MSWQFEMYLLTYINLFSRPALVVMNYLGYDKTQTYQALSIHQFQITCNQGHFKDLAHCCFQHLLKYILRTYLNIFYASQLYCFLFVGSGVFIFICFMFYCYYIILFYNMLYVQQFMLMHSHVTLRFLGLRHFRLYFSTFQRK